MLFPKEIIYNPTTTEQSEKTERKMAYKMNGKFYDANDEEMEMECHECFTEFETAKDLKSWVVEIGNADMMARIDESKYLLYFHYPRCDHCYKDFCAIVDNIYDECCEEDSEDSEEDEE